MIYNDCTSSMFVLVIQSAIALVCGPGFGTMVVRTLDRNSCLIKWRQDLDYPHLRSYAPLSWVSLSFSNG